MILSRSIFAGLAILAVNQCPDKHSRLQTRENGAMSRSHRRGHTCIGAGCPDASHFPDEFVIPETVPIPDDDFVQQTEYEITRRGSEEVFNLFDVLSGMAGRSMSVAIPSDTPNIVGFTYPFGSGFGAGSISKTTVLEYRGPDDKSQPLTVCLGVDVPPSQRNNIPAFLLEWGAGGSHFLAIVDAWPGHKITVNASFIRISAVSLGNGGGPTAYVFSASLSVLPHGNFIKPRTLVGPYYAASPQTVFFPPFTDQVTFFKDVAGDAWTLDFKDTAGTIVFSLAFGAGSQISQPVKIPGNVSNVTMTRTVGAGLIVAEADLNL